MSDTVDVLALDQIAPGRGRVVRVAGCDLALFRVGDEVFAIGAACELDSAEVDAALSAARPLAPSMLGAEGVPHFIFNDDHALSGAHSADVLLAVMQAASRELQA